MNMIKSCSNFEHNNKQIEPHQRTASKTNDYGFTSRCDLGWNELCVIYLHRFGDFIFTLTRFSRSVAARLAASPTVVIGRTKMCIWPKRPAMRWVVPLNHQSIHRNIERIPAYSTIWQSARFHPTYVFGRRLVAAETHDDKRTGSMNLLFSWIDKGQPTDAGPSQCGFELMTRTVPVRCGGIITIRM